MKHANNFLNVAAAISFGALVYAAPCTAADEALKVDPNLPAYGKKSGVSGNLNSVGSDTLNNLMTFWSEGFSKFYPGVKVQIEGKGSSTAPPALISGTAQLGPMSRAMKQTEIDAFEEKFGYKPTAIPVAVDALAVFVNKDNTIGGLSIPQVDAIFSKSRLLGGAADLTTWEQIDPKLPGTPISLYGRNSASGTYGFFKQVALGDGDYKDTVKEQPGSASVVQSVSVDRGAIGYSGIGYKTAGVRALPLSSVDGGTLVDPTAENAYSGDYPLARFLFVYVNKSPTKPVSPLVTEFVSYILSSEGQQIVIKDGYFPLSADLAAKEVAKLK